MKALKLKSILIAATAAAGFAAGSAMAVPMADTFLEAFVSKNSSEKTELGYFNKVSGMKFTSLEKFDGEIDEKSVAEFDTETKLWVINLKPSVQPSYFLLKFGSGNVETGLDTYVFQNINDLSQLVWRNEQVGGLSGGDCSTNGNGGSCNIGRLSHISYVVGGDGTGGPGGNPGEVPEPASLALLGAGLAGMALRRRRG